MNRRKFIKLTSLFTALFPFMRVKKGEEPYTLTSYYRIGKSAKYDWEPEGTVGEMMNKSDWQWTEEEIDKALSSKRTTLDELKQLNKQAMSHKLEPVIDGNGFRWVEAQDLRSIEGGFVLPPGMELRS